MRLLLDAHVSGPSVGRRLTAEGHDVRALDQEPGLEGLPDDDVLTLAAQERRILVTRNVADFMDIVRDWAEAGDTHAGAILIHGLDHREFDLIVRGVRRALALYDDWTDLTMTVDRAFATSTPER